MTDTLDIFVDAVTRASVFKCADIAAPEDTPINQQYCDPALLANACTHFVSVHCSAPHRRCSGEVRFLQLP
jgi:hypothetical protein